MRGCPWLLEKVAKAVGHAARLLPLARNSLNVQITCTMILVILNFGDGDFTAYEQGRGFSVACELDLMLSSTFLFPRTISNLDLRIY